MNWKAVIEMILNGILIGGVANLICPNVHRLVEWGAKWLQK